MGEIFVMLEIKIEDIQSGLPCAATLEIQQPLHFYQ